MRLKLKRYSDNEESTLGLMYVDNKFFCYALEDEFRINKLKGDTRIPEGTYEIKLRKVESPMTLKYRDKYNWFDYHLELQDVPNFKNVYIHVGNTDDDTDGCILVGDTANNNRRGDGFISNSRQAFKELYIAIKTHLKNGFRIFIKIESIENA